MTGARVITGATILAPTPLPPTDDSVAVVDGRIVAVGSREQVAAAVPADHDRIDLGGRVLAPGFVDAHLHPLPMCFFEHHLDLSGCTGLDEVLDGLRQRALATAADGWVVGLQLDDECLAERRLPTRAELDAVGDGRPVVILRRDGHHALGSTAALAAAGIDPTTPDPPGGVIHRAVDGTLTGLCGEAAASLLLAAVPVPSWDELSSALDRLVTRLAACGVTGVSAICQTSAEGPAGAAGEMEALAWSLMVDRVPFDVQTILVAAGATGVDEHRAGALHDPGRRRRLDAVKLFLDGTLGGRTACMHRPYADGDGEGAGMLTLAPEDAYARMVDAHTAGLQICVHAIGDRANATAADLYARLLREHPADDHRHRVEHASVLDDATIDAFAGLGVAAVVQPVSIAGERRWLARRLGGDRLASVYPYRRMLDAGVRVAGSSDAPIETPDVLAAMACAVDRLGVGEAEAVTPVEALEMYTSSAAWVRRTDHDSGTIRPGARADLVVLSGDPRHGLDDVDVLATLVAGVVVHDDPRLGPW